LELIHDTRTHEHKIHILSTELHRTFCSKYNTSYVGIENNKVRYWAAIFIQLNSSLQREAKSEASGVRVACIVESFLHILYTTVLHKAQSIQTQVIYMGTEQTEAALTKGKSAEDLFIRKTNNSVSDIGRNIKSILENTTRRTHDIQLNMLIVFTT
jgi:hypothetical protein